MLGHDYGWSSTTEGWGSSSDPSRQWSDPFPYSPHSNIFAQISRHRSQCVPRAGRSGYFESFYHSTKFRIGSASPPLEIRFSKLTTPQPTTDAADAPKSGTLNTSPRSRVDTVPVHVTSQSIKIKDEPMDEPLPLEIPLPATASSIKVDPQTLSSHDLDSIQVFYLDLSDPFGFDAYDIKSLSQVRAWLESKLLFGRGSLQSFWSRRSVSSRCSYTHIEPKA